MPRQIVMLRQETSDALRAYIKRNYSGHRVLSYLVDKAIEEYLKRQTVTGVVVERKKRPDLIITE